MKNKVVKYGFYFIKEQFGGIHMNNAMKGHTFADSRKLVKKEEQDAITQ